MTRPLEMLGEERAVRRLTATMTDAEAQIFLDRLAQDGAALRLDQLRKLASEVQHDVAAALRYAREARNRTGAQNAE